MQIDVKNSTRGRIVNSRGPCAPSFARRIGRAIEIEIEIPGISAQYQWRIPARDVTMEI